MSHPFKVAQLNTRASLTPWKLAELAAFEQKVDVFLIQDPPATAKSHRWSNFTLVLPRVVNPSVAILIRRGIKFRLEGWGSERVMWTTLFFWGLKLAVVCAYIRHTSGEGVHELSRAVARASEVTQFVLLGADSNGHSPSWGPRNNLDAVGRLVEDVLSEGHLLVLNSSDLPPTFYSDHVAIIRGLTLQAASPALLFPTSLSGGFTLRSR